MWTIPSSNRDGRVFMSIIIAFTILAVLSFGMRVYSRRLSKGTIDASDYTCFLGLVLGLGVVVCSWGAFSHGWGDDSRNLDLAEAAFASKLFFPIEIVWNSATVCIRISMLLLYIHIFPIPWFRSICWMVSALNIAGAASVILGTLLICRPLLYNFDKTIPNGHCGNLIGFELSTAIMNMVLDSFVVVLPIPMLLRLQMPRRKKIGICIIFGMGIVICALTLTRVLATKFYFPDDFTKSAALTALITALEPIIGVTNACLPFLPLVFKQIRKTAFLMRVSNSLNLFLTKRKNGRRLGQSDTERAISGSQFIELKDQAGKHPKQLSFKYSSVSTSSQNGGPAGAPLRDEDYAVGW